MIRRFYELGYDCIVPVIPPGAQLSPHSRVSPSQLGKIPGRWTKEGWVGYDLTKREYPNLAQAEAYERLGSNFGLAADRFPGLDIDVDDPDLTVRLVPTFWKLLGEAPVRYSTGSRGLLVYASDEPLPRIRLVLKKDGVSHAVELLGRDRQYVVQGVHPSGHRYGFNPNADLVPVGDLPRITLDQVREAFAKVADALGAEGWECSIHEEGQREERALVDQEELKAPTAKHLAKVVRDIPNLYDDRADWIRVGHAIKAASQDFPHVGFQIWQWWSEQWEGGNEPEEIARNWDRMHSPFEVGYPYLVTLAGGGQRLAQEMFSPDPDAVEEEEVQVFVQSTAPEYTDLWALDQIQDELANHLIYNPQRGLWMIWDGHKWAPDAKAKALDIFGSLLQRVSWSLIDAAANMGDKEGRALIATAKKYQNYAAIKAVKTLAESRLGLPNDRFDADLMKLNTPAGVVDLVSGEVSPPSPEVLVSRSTTVAPAEVYDPAKAPLWETFLQDLTGGDRDMIAFYQEMSGYCLTGSVAEKSLFYIWGSKSDTGKSTFIRVIQDIMGSYSDTVPVQSIISKSGESDSIPNDIAKIAGARLVTATEPATGKSWNEERVKAMTGGDLISARFMRMDFFEYYPTYKILIVGNHEPDIENTDDAMLRRIRIIPANFKVPKEKQIKDLSVLIVKEEGPQVLRWMIDGCTRWVEQGELILPSAVKDATAAYGEEENLLDQFVEERCVVGEGFFVSRAKLYKAWRNFCYARGEDPGTEKGFKRLFAPKAADLDLRSDFRGQDPGDTEYRRGYQGIKLVGSDNLTFTPGG